MKFIVLMGTFADYIVEVAENCLRRRGKGTVFTQFLFKFGLQGRVCCKHFAPFHLHILGTDPELVAGLYAYIKETPIGKGAGSGRLQEPHGNPGSRLVHIYIDAPCRILQFLNLGSKLWSYRNAPLTLSGREFSSGITVGFHLHLSRLR